MDDVVEYRALEAFCRQRAKMEGESSAFWLKQADVLAKLITTEIRLQSLQSKAEQKRPPDLGA